MHIQVCGTLDEVVRSVGWVSRQPDGAISVGLSDRTFVSPNFRSRDFLWNAYNRITLEYRIAHTPDALEPISNPHLTFHPPIYFHLREDRGPELWAGIADVWIMLTQERRVPWVRYVSKPFSELKIASAPRNPSITMIQKKVAVPNAECSIGLAVDFVHVDGGTPPEWVTNNFANASGGVDIDIRAEILHPQESTLVWLHHY